MSYVWQLIVGRVVSTWTGLVATGEGELSLRLDFLGVDLGRIGAGARFFCVDCALCRLGGCEIALCLGGGDAKKLSSPSGSLSIVSEFNAPARFTAA